MELQEFKDKKKAMENRIRDYIQKEVIGFRNESKLSPYSINVNLVEVTTVGDKNRHYSVNKVDTYFEI